MLWVLKCFFYNHIQNDRPHISKTTLELPKPLPYKKSDITEEGFKVLTILTNKIVSDPDPDSQIGKPIIIFPRPYSNKLLISLQSSVFLKIKNIDEK